MDFMDDDMKTIARKAYRQPGGLYAACEAVLAEQQRRQAPQEPQMDATMADEVRQQPADDVVQRMIDAYFGCKERSIMTGTTWLRPSMAAALAVAREGMYSLEQVENVAKLAVRSSGWGDGNAAVQNKLVSELRRHLRLLTAKPQEPTEQERVTIGIGDFIAYLYARSSPKS